MKKLNYLLALASVTAVLCLSADRLSAQQPPQGRGGNFDPEQARQRMMERYKEQLDVESDDEWKVIQARSRKSSRPDRSRLRWRRRRNALRPKGRGGGGDGNNAPQ